MSTPYNANLISTKLASEISGYHPDYIARLCRAGKIKSSQFGRSWLIDQDSLTEFCKNQELRKKENAEELSRKREEEYRTARSSRSGLSEPKIARTAPVAAKPVRSIPSPFFDNAVAAVVALLFGTLSLYSLHSPLAQQVGTKTLEVASSAATGLRILASELPGWPEAGSIRIAHHGVNPVPPIFNGPILIPSVARTEVATEMLAVSDTDFNSEAVRDIARDLSRISYEHIVATAINAVGHPQETATNLYRGMGEGIRSSVANGLLAYSYGLVEAGDLWVSAGATVRDGLLAAGGRALQAEIGFGKGVTQTAGAIVDLHTKGVYAFVRSAPVLSVAVLKPVYMLGNGIAASTASLPRTLAGLYDQGVLAWVEGSWGLAEATETRLMASAAALNKAGEGVREAYMRGVEGTGTLAYAQADSAVTGTRVLGTAVIAAFSGKGPDFNIITRDNRDTFASVAQARAASQGAAVGGVSESIYKSGEDVALYTYVTINSLFYRGLSAVASIFQQPQVAFVPLPAQPEPAPAGTSSSYSIVSQTPVQNIVNQITIQGVTFDYLERRLRQVRSSILDSRAISDHGHGGGGGSGSVTSIDASGGSTGFSFTGGPVTSSGTLTLSGTLDVDNGGTGISSAPVYGELLVGDGLGGYSLVATSSLGITSGGTPGGATTQVQFNNAGAFGGDAAFTFNATDDRLTVTNASTTNITSTYASSTNAFFGNLSVGSLSGVLKATAGAVSAGLVNLASEVTGGLPVGNGGTGVATIQPNALLLGNGTGAISTTSPGTNGQILALLSGIPTWVATSSINNGVTSIQHSYGSAQTGMIVLATSTQTFNGLTFGNSFTNVGGTFTFTPSVSGTLDNAGLTNSTVSYGGVTLSLGGTDATPAFDLSDATGLPIVAGTTGTLTQARGGTGFSSYGAGDLLYADGSGNLSKLGIGSPGQVLKVSGSTLPSWGADQTSGGGGAGAWATTTDSLAIYPSDTSDVVIIGNSATSTVGNILEVVGNSLFRGVLTTYNAPIAPNFTSTSTVAINTFPNLSATNATTTSFGINSETFTDLTGTGLSNVGGVLTLNATGDWTGLFDGQEGSYYLDRANHTGTQLAATISDFNSAVNSFISASTTIPKTYTSNTFTGAQTFTGGVTIGTLNGPLQANNGVVSATTSIGVLYGGTGLTSAPTYGQLLVGNSSGGYTPTATSSLGLVTSAITALGPTGQTQTGPTITIATSTSANNGITSVVTVVGSGNTLTITPSQSGTLTVAGGGTGATTFTSSQLLYGNGTNALSSVATTSITLASEFSHSGTIGSLIGGAAGTLSLATNGVALTKVAQIAANSILGNTTGATGNVTAIATSSLGINLGDTTGTLGVTRGGTGTTTWMNGAVAFYDSTLGTLSQAASQAAFFFDKANGRLGLGSSSPTGTLTLGSGQLIVPVGSASAPSIVSDQSVNSGIYFSGTGQTISFGTVGSARFTLGSSFDAANAAGPSIVNNSSLTGPVLLPNKTQTTTGFGAGTAGNITAIVGGTELSRWTSTGFGIGTSSPFALLSISNSASTAANTPLFAVASTTAGTATTTLFTIDANGRVGIGTAPASGYSLNTSNGIQSASIVAASSFQGAAGPAFTFGSDTDTGIFGSNNQNYVGVSTAGSEVARFTTSGLGIGTSTPYAKLSVVGETVASHFTATTTSTNTFPHLSTTNATSTGSFYITPLGTAAGTFLAADPTGRIIATTTSGFLTSAITALGPTGQTQTGSTITIATSTSATNGITSAITITGSGNTLTFTPSQSGTRTVAGGGTGQTTFTSSQLLYGNGTAALSSVATTSITLASEFSHSGTIGALIGGSSGTLSLATNGVALTKIAQIAANSILGNSTGSTGNVTAIATSSLGIAISDTTGTLAVTRGGTGTTTWMNGAIAFYDSTLGTLSQAASQAALFFNKSTGRLGIGTTSPGALIDLGTGAVDKIYLFNDGNNKYGLGINSGELNIFAGNGGAINLRNGGSAGTSRLYISSAGDIGIGSTTPWAKLSVTNTGTGPSFVVEDSTSPDTTPFIIDASGNVGIGTSTPAAKLDVNGSVAGTSFYIGNPLAAYYSRLYNSGDTHLHLSSTGDSTGNQAAHIYIDADTTSAAQYLPGQFHVGRQLLVEVETNASTPAMSPAFISEGDNYDQAQDWTHAAWIVGRAPNRTSNGGHAVLEINSIERNGDQGYQETWGEDGKSTAALVIVPESELALFNDGGTASQSYNNTFGILIGRSAGLEDAGGRTYAAAKWHVPFSVNADATSASGTSILLGGGTISANKPNIGIKFINYHNIGIDFASSTLASSAIRLSTNQNIEYLTSSFGSGYGFKVYGVDVPGTGTSYRIAGRSNSATFTDLFTIRDTGNIGIGTTTPGSALSIQGNIFLAGNIISTSTATSTFAGDINLPTGKCFQINGSCIGGSGGSGITALGPTGQTQTGSTITIATSTNTTNGITSAVTVVGSGNTLTFTPSQSGTLTVAGGGTGVGTFTSGQLLYGNGTNALSSVATSSLAVNGSITSSGTLGSQIGGSNTTLSLNMANANSWTALQSFAAASSTLFSNTGTAYFGGTATSTFNSAGQLTLAGGLNGPLQANNGLVSATTSIGVLYGGTGLTSAPTYGQFLVGNSSGGYTLTATSSFGLNFGSVAQANRIGSPTQLNTLLDIFNTQSSAGIVKGGDITDNGDGTVSIAAGEALLRSGATATSTIYSVSFAAQNNISLTNNSTNYIYLDYNGGSPTFNVGTSLSSFNCQDKCLAYMVVRQGTTLSIVDGTGQNVDSNRKHRRLLLEIDGFQHVKGGSMLSSTGTRNIAVTSGAFYFGLNRIDHDAFDTSGSDTFDYYYANGSGGWTRSTGNTQIDNVHYDNGSGTLANVSVGDYGVFWVYVVNSTTPHLAVQYGTQEYDTFAMAQAATVPTPPPALADAGALLGRVIIARNASTLAAVESAFNQNFAGATVTNHNNLAGLQGGTVDEYYHLTASEYTGTGTGVFVRANNAVLGNASSTMLSVLDGISIGRTSTTTIRGDGLASTLPFASTTGISASYASSTNAFFGNLSVGNLTGFLKATAGVVSTATIDLVNDVGSSILAVVNGGTGWGNITANTVLLGNGTSRLATTSAGTNGQVLALVNGVPTWTATTTLSTISGTLGVAGGGTGTTTWMNGAVAFYDSTLGTLSQAASQATFFFDKTNGRLGLGTTSPQGPLHVVSTDGTNAPYLERVESLIDNSVRTSARLVARYSAGQMANGFGAGLNFEAMDVDGTANTLGLIAGVRSNSSDTTGDLVFQTSSAGSLAEKLRLTYTGNLGIGTSSPYARLSVAGETVASYFTATTTNTNTLPHLSTTNATSTDSFYITPLGTAAGTFLAADPTGRIIATTSPSSGGITALGPTGQTQTGSTITLATSTSATNGITSAVTVVGSGNTLTFTPSQSGTLTVAGGGTGQTTFTSSQLLYGNGTNALSSVATSSLAVGGSITSSGTLGSQIGGSNTTLSLNMANANSWTALQSFAAASSTLFSNTGTAYFGGTATSTFNSAGQLTLAGALNGPLQANNGLVSATTSIGAIYGGTGQTSYTTGDILYASNATTLTKLGVGSDGQVLKVTGGVPTWGSDATSGGGTGAWATTTDNLAIYPSDTSDVVIIGNSATSTTGNILEVVGNSLFRGLVTAYNTVTAPIFTATSTSATSTFPNAAITNLSLGGDYISEFVGTGLTLAGGALTTTLGTAVDLVTEITGTLGVGNGGTGWDTITANTVLLGNGTSRLATTSAGTNGQVLALVNGVPTWTATTTLSTISGTLAVSSGGTGATTFTSGQLLYGNGTNALSSVATTSITLASEFSHSGTIGSLIGGSSGTLSLATNGVALTKIAQIAANSILGNSTGSTGNVTAIATSSLGIAISDTTGTLTTSRGGTGTTTWMNGAIAFYDSTLGTLSQAGSQAALFFNKSTGRLGIGTTSPGALIDLGTGITDKIYLFNDGNNKYGLGLNSGELNIFAGNGGAINFRNNGSAGNSRLYIAGGGNIGLGTSSPSARLSIHANNGDLVTMLFSIGSSTASATTTLFAVDNSGNVGIGTSSPYARLSVAGETVASYFTATTTNTNTFPHLSTTNATSTDSFYITPLGTAAGTFLAADPTGRIIATTSPSSGGITALGPTGQTQTGSTITLATSTSAFNGLTPNLTITGSGNTLTYTSALSGTLGVAGGGTGVGTFTSGQLLYGNGTAALSSVATTSITLASEFSHSGTIGALIGGSSGTLSLATNGVALTKIAQIAANSILGNSTGSTGNVTAIATSSLGIAISDTTGTLTTSRGGTGTTTWMNGGAVFYDSVLGTLSQAASQAAFFFDKTNSRLGIGTTAPSTAVEVWADGTPLGYNATLFTSVSPNNLPTNTFKRGRGSTASPSDVTADDRLGGLVFQGYGGGAFRTSSAVIGQVDTSGTISATSMPGALLFLTASNGGTSAIERMRVNSTGAVGIGTSTPQWALTVASSTGPQLVLTDASATQSPWTFRSINGSFYLATSSVTTFATSSVSALAIDTSGLLTVAKGLTITPLGTAAGTFLAADATGRIIATTTPSGSGITALGPTGQTQTGSTITIATSTSATNGITSAVTVVGSGNTLTLTPSQSGTLTVAGGGTGTTTWMNGAIAFYDSTLGTLSQASSQAALFFNKSTGRLGIGTSSPGASLDFGNAIADKIYLYNDGSNKYGLGVNSGELNIFSGSGGAINFRNGGTAGTSRLYISSAGNVGVGTTTPAFKFQIASDYVNAGNIDAGQFAISGATDPTKRLSLGYDTTSNYAFIKAGRVGVAFDNIALAPSGGNVGVGTTTPWRRLSVTDTSTQFVTGYDTTRYTQFTTDSGGDLTIDPQGADIFATTENLWICSGGTCPTGTPSGTGNIIAGTAIGVASSTPWAGLSLASGKAIVVGENTLATSTSMTIDWRNGNQQLVRIGTSATTISFSGYIEGQKLVLTVCNPGSGSTGAISWGTQILWSGGTAPTQTTTVNKCDVWSFLATNATSTLKIFGSQTANF